MQPLSDIFSQIFRNLWAHKLRSFLTMFGIAWGVGSLLLLVGVGEGFRSGNKRELAEFGKDIMFLFPGRAPGKQEHDVLAKLGQFALVSRTESFAHSDQQQQRSHAPRDPKHGEKRA